MLYSLITICVSVALIDAYNVRNSDLVISPATRRLQEVAGSSLQINCTAKTPTPPDSLMWKKNRSEDKLHYEMLDNYTASLYIAKLSRGDAGSYTCIMKFRQRQHTKFILLSVLNKARNGPCSSSHFHCGSGHCIFQRYRCDGIENCPDGSDESPRICVGASPCPGKFRCNNSQCIDFALVCDIDHMNHCGDWSDEDCFVLNSGNTRGNSGPPLKASDDNMIWLRTTVYAVIGSTVGVVLFLSIMVIVVFRVRTRREVAQRALNALRRQRQQIEQSHNPVERDIFLPPAYGNIIVNINNGVQFVPATELTSLMEVPPPYSERLALSHEDSPPPPYATVDRLQQTIDTTDSGERNMQEEHELSARTEDTNTGEDGSPTVDGTALETPAIGQAIANENQDEEQESNEQPVSGIIEVRDGQIVCRPESGRQVADSVHRTLSGQLVVIDGQISLSDGTDI